MKFLRAKRIVDHEVERGRRLETGGGSKKNKESLGAISCLTSELSAAFVPTSGLRPAGLEPDPHYPKSAGLIDRGVFGRTR